MSITQSKRRERYFVSQYTDGPSSVWNVIDGSSQEWIVRFRSMSEAITHAARLNARIYTGADQ